MHTIRWSLRRALIHKCLQSRPVHVYSYPMEKHTIIAEKPKERIKYSGQFARSNVKLSKADEELLNRGDFIGVRAATKKSYKKVELEVAVGRFQEQLHTNRRINAEHFFVDILIPLEKKDSKMVAAILKNPDYYVPTLFQCCGSALTSIHLSKRKIILGRLISALEKNHVPFSLAAINALLEARLENEDHFNVDQILREVELRQELTPDSRFFNNLLWQLACKENHLKLEDMKSELLRRGLKLDENAYLATIYCNERHGHVLQTERLVNEYGDMFGAARKSEAISAACRGAAAGCHIDRLRALLRLTLYSSAETGRKITKLPGILTFDIIWTLAKISRDGQGKEWSPFIRQLLGSAFRTSGFFKLLICAVDKHVQHGYFYSAAEILNDTLRIRDSLTNQRRATFIHQALTSFVNRMIQQNVETKIIMELANRIVTAFGPSLRIWDDIVYAILTFKEKSPQDRFDQFCVFVDLVDPERERIHIILPLLTTCEDPMARCKMLFRCSRIGYTNIADLSSSVLSTQIVVPLLETSYNPKSKRVSDHSQLDYVANSIKSFGIPAEDVWKLLWNVYCNWVKGRRSSASLIQLHNFQLWLKTRKNECFPARDPLAEKELERMDFAMLSRFIDARNVEAVHAFLLKRGFPPDADMELLTESLIDLYIELASWEYLQKLLRMLSEMQKRTVNYAEIDPADLQAIDEGQILEDTETKCYVKNHHLLSLLRRRMDEMPKYKINITELIEYVYELKRMFPSAVSTNETFLEAINGYRRLFRAIIYVPPEGSMREKIVDPAVELLNVLVRMEIIRLHQNETLTPFIVLQVLLRVGWVEAVETWLKFQGSFFCSNGILELLLHALRENNQQKVQFLIHRARNVINPSKITAWLASCYISLDRLDEAIELMKTCEERPSALDMVSVFRVSNIMTRHTVKRNRGIVGAPKYHSLSFVRLALEFTDLRDNEKAMDMCNRDWLSICQRDTEGLTAQRFLKLFDEYGVQLSSSVHSAAQELIDWHNKLVDKYIINPNTALLNTQSVFDEKPADDKMSEELQTTIQEIVDKLFSERNPLLMQKPEGIETDEEDGVEALSPS